MCRYMRKWNIRFIVLYEKALRLKCARCEDKYCTAVTSNVQDIMKLLETGFEYVCSHKDEMLFRKRK